MSIPDDRVERQKLLAAVMVAVRDNSTAAVFFHTAIAAQVSLGATESKTISILDNLGPLTAGEIAQHTGLATASVTSLIDRLELKGFVHRVRDLKDRRRVIVELDEQRFSELTQLFSPIYSATLEYLEGYSNEQLALITEFLTRATQYSGELIAQLGQDAPVRKNGRNT